MNQFTKKIQKIRSKISGICITAGSDSADFSETREICATVCREMKLPKIVIISKL